MNKRKDKSEIIGIICKYIVTALVIPFLLFIIRTTSPGNYQGDELTDYLSTLICNYADVETYTQTKRRHGFSDELSQCDIIISGGEYSKKDGSTGRIIAVFEQGKESFWDQLIGIRPRFKLVFTRVLEAALTYQDHVIDEIERIDYDRDGLDDYLVTLRTTYADRIAEADFILSRFGGQWHIVSFDTGLLNEEVVNQDGYSLMYEAFKLLDPKNVEQNDCVLDLSHQGTVFFIEDPLKGDVDICYRVGVIDGTTGYRVSHFAYYMFKCSGDELQYDPNWKRQPVIVRVDEDVDLYDYWGVQIGDMVFYQ